MSRLESLSVSTAYLYYSDMGKAGKGVVWIGLAVLGGDAHTSTAKVPLPCKSLATDSMQCNKVHNEQKEEGVRGKTDTLWLQIAVTLPN